MRALAVAGGVAVAAGVAWYLSRRPAAWYLSRPPSGAAAHGHGHEHEHTHSGGCCAHNHSEKKADSEHAHGHGHGHQESDAHEHAHSGGCCGHDHGSEKKADTEHAHGHGHGHGHQESDGKPVLTPEEAEAAAAVQKNLLEIRSRVAAVPRPAGECEATLIAVSKTKPASLLSAAYSAGQRDFGENYVHEVVEKAPVLPADIRWHFIGHLQTNKVKDLVAVPGLHCVHTVDSAKLARELQKRVALLRPDRPLNIMVQVNTSAEESKSGCTPEGVVALCAEVAKACPLLRLCGLMCIGKYSAAEGSATQDFEVLKRCREQVAAATSPDPATQARVRMHMALSMGMSHDFEAALAAGATHVRVGSSIFGARAPKPVSS